MKIIPIALATKQAAAVTRLAFIWKITRTDGQVFGLTSHAADIEFEGIVYKAKSGIDPSQIVSSGDFAVDNLAVSGFFSDELFTEDAILNRVWDYAQVTLSRVDWSAPALGCERMRAGMLGEISTGKYGYKAELLGLFQQLQQTVGRIYTAECDANLGDKRCGLNIASFTFTGVATTSEFLYTFDAEGFSPADGYFNGGVLTWTSGDNIGRRIEVKSFVAGKFDLQEAMVNSILDGDTFSVHAGCNKIRDQDCLAKFNNIVNHRGFPSKPTKDKVNQGK